MPLKLLHTDPEPPQVARAHKHGLFNVCREHVSKYGADRGDAKNHHHGEGAESETCQLRRRSSDEMAAARSGHDSDLHHATSKHARDAVRRVYVKHVDEASTPFEA